MKPLFTLRGALSLGFILLSLFFVPGIGEASVINEVSLGVYYVVENIFSSITSFFDGFFGGIARLSDDAIGELLREEEQIENQEQQTKNIKFGTTEQTENIKQETIGEIVVADQAPSTPTPAPLPIEIPREEIPTRIVERIVTSAPLVVSSTGITQSVLENQLNILSNTLRSEIYRVAANASSASAGNFTAIALSNTLDKLPTGIVIDGAIITGSLSGLTDAHVPDGITASNYLPLSGGTLTGTLSGTDLTLSGDITVLGTQVLSGVLTVPYINATSTSATSTFSGGLAANALNITSTSATSTFANGIRLSGGCFAGTNGECVRGGFSSNGSGATTLVASTDNVGIGTSSPYAKLSIVGEVVASHFTGTTTATSTFAGGLQALALNITSTSATSTFANGIRLSGGCFETADGTCAGGGGAFVSAGGFTTLSTATDFVGLGTSSPYAKLSVVGEVVASHFTATSSATSTFAGEIVGATHLFLPAQISGPTIHFFANDYDTGFYSDSDGYIYAVGNSADVFSIKPDGNFYLNESLQFDDGGSASVPKINWAETSDENTGIFRPTADTLGFSTGGTERLTINSSGNVGIGTTSPYAKLSVAAIGGATTNLFSIASSSNQDYITVDYRGAVTQRTRTNPTLVGTYDTTGNARGIYVSGKYAYVADEGSGLQIIDLSNPSTPILVGTYDTTGNAFGIYVSGKYAYVADGSSGLQVIDISNPSTPILVGTYDTTGSSQSISISGKYAYVADLGSGLQIIDISNPASPTLTGTYDTTGNARGIYVSGKYAYVGDSLSGFQIVDISNPSTPLLIGTYNTPGDAYSTYISGKYAYVADLGSGLQIIDISNPASPTLTGTYDTTGNARGIYVSGKYAYVADGSSGLQVIDISNPSTPILVGTYDTTGQAYNIYFSGKYVYITDYDFGLQVIDIGGIETPALYAGNIETNVLNATENIVSGNDIYARNGITAGQGGISANGTGSFSLFATTSLSTLTALSGSITDSNSSSIVDVLTISHLASSTAGNNIGAGLLFKNEDADGFATSTGQIASVFTSVSTTSPTSALTFSTKNANTGLTERLRIDNAGNVGIGTTSPYAKLSVVGEVVASHFTGTTTATSTLAGGLQALAFNITSTSATSTFANGIRLSGGCFQSADGTCAGGGGAFTSAGGYTTLSTATDFVGIGTATPYAKLSLTATGGQTAPLLAFASSSNQNFLTVDYRGAITQQTRTNPTLVGTYDTTGSAYSVQTLGKYAYVADEGGGFHVVDISNPITPTLMGTYDTPGNAYDVFLSGKYAYVAGNDFGIHIIDISNPAFPMLVGTYNTTGSAFNIYISGKYAYVADGASGLQIIDVSNPSSPTLVGTYNTTGFAYDVTIFGNYAYVADDSSGLQIIDISNPIFPILVGTSDTPGSAYGVFLSGKYAYVADVTPGLQIIDISNPASPTPVGTYDTTGFARDVSLSGNYAYVADDGSGLQIIDISNPNLPTLVGTYNTGFAYGVFLSGKYAYVANLDSGLQIIDIGGIETPALYAGNIETNVLNATENIVSGNDIYARNGITAGQGGISANGTGSFSLFATTSLSTLTALSGSITDSNSSSIVDVLTISHLASSTASNNIGAGLLFRNEDADGFATSTGQIASVFTSVSTTSPTSALTFSTKNANTGLTERVRIDNAGNVGIGTTSPSALLHIGSSASQNNVRIANGYLCVDDNDTCTGATTAGTVYAVGAYTTGADLAEQYPTKDQTLSAGEIVTFDTENAIFVKKADKTSSFIGVVSTQPGVLLGGYKAIQFEAEKNVPIALAGRVPVKVNGEGGDINIGDRITVSSVSGVGMKATTSAPTIGIAIESFDASEENGEIIVFIDFSSQISGVSSGSIEFDGIGDSAFWQIGASGKIEFINAIDMRGFGLYDVKEIIGSNGKWMIDANGNLTVQQVTTDRLCIGETCINESQFRSLLQNASVIELINTENSNSTPETASTTEEEQTENEQTENQEQETTEEVNGGFPLMEETEQAENSEQEIVEETENIQQQTENVEPGTGEQTENLEP